MTPLTERRARLSSFEMAKASTDGEEAESPLPPPPRGRDFPAALCQLMTRLDLALSILIYAASSVGGVVIVKHLNYTFCFSSAFVLAMVSRSTWVLALLLHAYLQMRYRIRLGISGKQLALYVGIAFGLSAVEGCNALSMAVLPGSWYALIKGSDVVFSMVLSAIFLQKRYPVEQVVAAGFIFGGISLVFVLGAPRPAAAHAHATAIASRNAANITQGVAAGACVAGALLNALMTVVTEGVLKETLRLENERLLSEGGAGMASEGNGPAHKLLLSNAYAMWTTMLSFGVLVGASAVAGDLGHWPAPDASCANPSATPSATTTAVAMGLCLALVGLTRFAERLSKHYICVRDSAMTFSVIQVRGFAWRHPQGQA